MPYWIPSPDPEFTNQLGTWFHLPKRGSPSSSSSVIAAGAMLDSLEPSTLLFLNQLMSLTITNRVLHTQVVYRKTWTSSDRVDLHTNMGDVQPWHVHGVSVDVPAPFASVKGASTRVQIAFPLSFDGSSLPNQPVFAYLPVQSYGFKCILQANFDLPSSREAILDNEWNQFLLRQFPRLFVDQLVQLLPEFPHLIRMIPVDIAPPFHLMGHAVVRLLQDLPLIQAASGAYVAPRHVLDQIEADHPISDALLWQSCQKHFIHPDFAPLLSPQSLKSVEDSLFYPLDVVDVPFADELNILHPEYIHALAPKTTRFLHVLGIKQLTTHDMLQFHLLPLVATSKTTEHDHAKALAFCMHVHIERPLPTPLLHLVRQSVRVVTASGDLTPLSTPHLSLEPPEFAFSALTVVAATSVVSSSSAFSFLQAVGLPVFMSLHSPDGVVPGLPLLLTSIVTNQNITGATALMQYLDRNWTAQHSATRGSVVTTLQTSPWLPTTTTTLLNPPTPAIALKYPNESYLDVPAGLKPYFPSSAVLNREFASVLQIHIGLGVPEYLHLLQLDAVSADTVVACLLELEAHATGQPDVLQSIQAALSAAPILPVNNQRVRLHHTIWKPSTSCPDLVALRPAFPKTLKSFFVQLGVPVKPTVAVALAALESSNVADPRPYLQFVAEQPLDRFPAQLEPIAFLTTTNGAKVSFESQPLLAEEEPSWWSHMSPNPSDKLVVISHPENAPFAGFWQFGTSLVQDVQGNPDKWNDLLHEAMMEESPHGSLVSGPNIQAFLCFLLDTWTTPNVVRISHLPTQGGVFEPFESVYATTSSQLRHPRALELPRRYHDILAKLWGLAMLPVTTSQPPIEAFLDSVQCWSAENLRVSFTVQSPPSSDDWTTSGVIIEAKPAVLDAFKLYINTPVEFPDVLSTVVSLLWSPLVAPHVARSLQPPPHRHQNPDPIPLKRQLFPLDLPPAKRPRQDFALRPPPSDSGDRMFQFRPNLLTDEAKFAIGRVGEAHVYDLLRTEYPPESVEWINEVEETGRPYDICIHHQSGGTEFIEVKSTSTYDKRVFEMSVQELECATQKGSQYSIYRAFAIRPQGALPDSRVIRLRNPITLLRHKKLALSVLMTDEVM
ncbi:hypothetical protein DYB28_003571 [Aphanomyces astaci]|uniref:Protein NO VEIN C-terminal domain-containing protein n=3 Tax=Aphanomyces astaci TaxID=112090 RepID=A0A9X8HGD5_APHAT|nr:hypothetical protein DYB28_003571 [Aphanomyces astaci]